MPSPFPEAPVVVMRTMALGAPVRRVFIWLSPGIALWMAAVMLAAQLGVTGFQKLAR